MKASMCNFVHESENGDLYLYNSLQGTKSLIFVNSRKASKIREMLSLEYSEEEDEEYNLLVKNGYLIEDDADEQQAREYKFLKVVSEPRLNITILPTEKCNFKCVYCYETFEKPGMSIETQESLISFVKKNINKYTGLSVHWFGGEPLIAMDVIENLSKEFISICKSVKKTYMAGMTTNGYLLDLEMLDKLLKCHVYKYQITIDGVEKTHDFQRPLMDGTPTFKRIVDNLVNIRLHAKSKLFNIAIRANLSKSIYESFDEYIEVLHHICGQDSRFSIYMHQVSDWGGERVTRIKEELIVQDMYVGALEKLKKSPFTFNYYVHLGKLDSESCVCYANKLNYFIIGADATLYKCTGNFVEDCNKIGKLESNGQISMDKNKEASWVCNVKRVMDKCKTCYFSGNCLFSICPAVQVRKLDSSICSFEQQYLAHFLELFSKDVYQIIE